MKQSKTTLHSCAARYAKRKTNALAEAGPRAIRAGAICLALTAGASSVHAGIAKIDEKHEVTSCKITALILGQTQKGHFTPAAKDARDMDALLRETGAITHTMIDIDKETALGSIKRFASSDPQSVHILYFSGLGGPDDGVEKIVFGDAVEGQPDVTENAIKIQDINEMLDMPGRTNIFIFDTQVSRTQPPKSGSLMLLGGSDAGDAGGGGRLTQTFLSNIREIKENHRHASLRNVFLKTVADVTIASNETQVPVLLSSPEEPPDLYFEGQSWLCPAKGDLAHPPTPYR